MVGQRIIRFVLRVAQALLGVMVAVAALFPLLVVSSLAFNWRALPLTIASVMTLVWCVETSWRLIANRGRSDGGLLSPWVIAGAGVVASAGAVLGFWPIGLPWIGGAIGLGAIAVRCFTLARERFRLRHRSMHDEP